jgi:hypothetical protein
MTRGWVKVGQRCGRYANRKVWVHIHQPRPLRAEEAGSVEGTT